MHMSDMMIMSDMMFMTMTMMWTSQGRADGRR
jgi:hypothetical protein